MTTPAENAATVREALLCDIHGRVGDGPTDCDGCRESQVARAALDALEAQAARVEELEAALERIADDPFDRAASDIARAALDKDTA